MDALRSFKYRNFKLFFYGQSISLLGSWIQKTAVVWLVYQMTGSAFLLGIVAFASLIPSLVLSPFAGSYIDQHDRFKTIGNLQRLAMFQAGMLAAFVYFHVDLVWPIILLTLFQGALDAFEVTCRQSLMVEMIDRKEDLPNAIALNSTLTNLTRVIGPAIVGILLTAFGEDACFIGNFLSYIPVLICLGQMHLIQPEKEKSIEKLWNSLKGGLDYIISEKEMLGLIILLASSSLIVIPFATLVPVFAKDIFEGTSTTFSLFESAIGAGSLFSAIYMAKLKGSDSLIELTIIASIIFSSGVLILALSQGIIMALIGMFLSGAGMMAQTSSVNTYIQTHAVSNMRSRAISYFVMSYLGVIPIGSLIIGFLAEHMSVRDVVALEGLLGLLSVTIYFVVRKQRQKVLIA